MIFTAACEPTPLAALLTVFAGLVAVVGAYETGRRRPRDGGER